MLIEDRFAATTPVAVSDHKIETDTTIRPPAQIISLAELEGTPLVLSGDARGYVSAWDVASGNRQTHDPEHSVEAHKGHVNVVMMLRSHRVADIVEECEWPAHSSASRVFSVSLAEQRKMLYHREQRPRSATFDDEDPKSHASHVAPRSGGSFDEPPQKGGVCAVLSRLCCCSGDREERLRYWLIATAADDGALRIWRWKATSRKMLKNPGAATFEVEFITEWTSSGLLPIISCLELHDGTIAVALKGSNDALVVDPITSKAGWVLFGHTGPVTAIGQCVEGQIVTGGGDGAVRVWAKRTWENDKEQEQQELPARAWEDPAHKMPGIGVSSMAFFAHSQQQQQSESVNVPIHILVQRAENLPKADLFGQSDPYVTVSVCDGKSGISESRTPTRRSRSQAVVFETRCSLSLGQTLEMAPESAFVNFQLCTVGGSCFGKDVVLGQWSATLEELCAHMARDPDDARMPIPRKLHAPAGEGPYERLKNATLTVGFERIGPNVLGCLIESAEELPVGFADRLYVIARMRPNNLTTPGSRIRTIATKVCDKTTILMSSLDPVWNEVLEVEVPAIHRDHKLEYSPDLVLHFEVFDYDHFSKDDVLATLDVPLAALMNHGIESVQRYDLALVPGYKIKRKKKKDIDKRLKEVQAVNAESGSEVSEALVAAPPLNQPIPSSPGASDASSLRQTAAQDASLAHRVSEFKTPRLHLGFQIITPCPKQLQCTVENAVGVLPMPAESAPVARIRLVEGNPILAHTSARKTGTCLRTTHPVWNEKCDLPVPEDYIKYCARRDVKMAQMAELSEQMTVAGQSPEGMAALIAADEKPPPPPSVRMGWEREHAAEPQLFLFAEIFDKNLSGNDTSMGSCAIPLDTIIAGVRQGKWSQSNRVPLSTSGHLHLGCEFGQGCDLIVHVDKADGLQPKGDVSADPYCVVRIAEQGAFQQPTCNLRGHSIIQDTHIVDENKTTPVWQHDMLLDLPGMWKRDGKVAMRSNWFAHVEVLEVDDYMHKEVPIMEGILPLTDLLSELASNEIPKHDRDIRSRIDALRWGQYTEKKAETLAPIDLFKEVELVAVRRNMKRGAKTPSASQRPQSGVSARPQSPGCGDVSMTGREDSGRTRPRTPDSQPVRPLTPSSVARSETPQSGITPVPSKGYSFGNWQVSTITSQKKSPSAVSRGVISMINTITRRADNSQNVDDSEIDIPNGSMRLRFQVLSRWQGVGRDRTKPMARTMTKASPVTCMTVLTWRIIAGYENGNIFVWDASGNSPVPLHQFEAHRVPISGLVYLAPLDALVTAAFPRTREEAVSESVVRTWSAATFDLRQTISMASATTRCVVALASDPMSKKRGPCLAVATETRVSKLIQTLRYKA